MSFPKNKRRIEACLFFAGASDRPGMIPFARLMKMLYLLDVGHVLQTGLPVTDLVYHALPDGPVPIILRIDMMSPGSKLRHGLEISMGPDTSFDWLLADRDADLEHFTPREMRIMVSLAERFVDDAGKSILCGMRLGELAPWAMTFDHGRGRGSPIPLAMAIPADDPHRAALLEAAAEDASRLSA